MEAGGEESVGNGAVWLGWVLRLAVACVGSSGSLELPNGTPITDRIIEASIQWAERIMQRIDALHSKGT